MRNLISLMLLGIVISHTYSMYVELPNVKTATKETIRTHHKPRRSHYRRTALADNGPEDIIDKTNESHDKRIVAGHGFNSSVSDIYETKVTYRPGPDFYADIFRIPISVLQAVSNFLGNNVAYINSTTIQGATPAQTGAKPRPPVISSLSLLTTLASPSVSQTSSPLVEAAGLSSALSDAGDSPSSLPDIAESPSLSSEAEASPRQ